MKIIEHHLSRTCLFISFAGRGLAVRLCTGLLLSLRAFLMSCSEASPSCEDFGWLVVYEPLKKYIVNWDDELPNFIEKKRFQFSNIGNWDDELPNF